MAAFWVVAPYSLAKVYRRFRDARCLHHQGDEWFTYQTTRRNNPEGRCLKIFLTFTLNRVFCFFLNVLKFCQARCSGYMHECVPERVSGGSAVASQQLWTHTNEAGRYKRFVQASLLKTNMASHHLATAVAFWTAWTTSITLPASQVLNDLFMRFLVIRRDKSSSSVTLKSW
jgi:hypothetical protein